MKIHIPTGAEKVTIIPAKSEPGLIPGKSR